MGRKQLWLVSWEFVPPPFSVTLSQLHWNICLHISGPFFWEGVRTCTFVAFSFERGGWGLFWLASQMAASLSHDLCQTSVKYIVQIWEILFTIKHKSVLQFWQIHLKIWTNTFAIHLSLDLRHLADLVKYIVQFWEMFLASQDALEVMRVTHLLTYSLTESLSVSIDFTDVTLVSDDTYIEDFTDVILITMMALMTLMKVI